MIEAVASLLCSSKLRGGVLLLFALVLAVEAGAQAKKGGSGLPGTPPASVSNVDPRLAPYVGDWVGNGWSWENRFRQSRNDFVSGVIHTDVLANRSNVDGIVMELTVQHETAFVLTVDAKGHIEGQGEIVYGLTPNLCGLAALTKQVNQAVNMMGKLPDIYKFANELGTAAVMTYNKDWYEHENDLAHSIEDVSKFATMRGVKPGTIEEVGMSEAELEKGLARKFDDMAESADTRALAYQTIVNRCSGPGSYAIVGGLPCDLIKSPPVEKEIESTTKVIGKEMNEDVNKVLEGISEIGKKRLEKLNRVEKAEELSCSELGPSTREKYVEQMKEKFTELLQSEAKGAGVGGVMGMLGAMATGAAAAPAFGMGALGGLSVPVDLILSVPGVTQVTYQYKGLKNGPEIRYYRLSGYIEPASGTMHLMWDPEVWGGKKNLEVDYMVNYKWSQGFFPTWSPFLDKDAQLHASGSYTMPVHHTDIQIGSPAPETFTSETPFAIFHDEGTHRGGTKPWQEYEYFWFAHKVTQPGNLPALKAIKPAEGKRAGERKH